MQSGRLSGGLGQPLNLLGINQAAVSKMERRADMYISTLQSMIRAMGGQLKIEAVFPEGKGGNQSVPQGQESRRQKLAWLTRQNGAKGWMNHERCLLVGFAKHSFNPVLVHMRIFLFAFGIYNAEKAEPE
jgi:hypothetical protein